MFIPAPAGWRALIIDYPNDDAYAAPIIAWRVQDAALGLYLEPICATGDPPGYPRIPNENELVAVYEPGDELSQGDFEAAQEQGQAIRAEDERREARA